MAAIAAGTPPPTLHLSMNLLGSHDTPRVRSHLGGSSERALLAAGLQLTWPGMPSVYYGDEVGMEGAGDPDCRRCMNWSPEGMAQTMLARYRELCHLRRGLPALARGGLREVACDPVANTYAYLRTHASGDVLVGVNAGRHPWTPSLPPGARRLDAATEESGTLPPLALGLWGCPAGTTVRHARLRGPGAGLDWPGA